MADNRVTGLSPVHAMPYGKAKFSIYQELIDLGFEVHELESKMGEGWTLKQIRQQAVEDGRIIED
jgi:hypothetical protein